jgi:aminoglycoside phosphotransferase (APT) family kinase protein
MSTIGHPLSDITNLINQYITASGGPNPQVGFAPGVTPGLPTQAQIVHWYREVAQWDPRLDLGWGISFSMFRQAIIMQGTAARVAQRQASSPEAKSYAALSKPFGEFAWKMILKAKGTAKI